MTVRKNAGVAFVLFTLLFCFGAMAKQTRSFSVIEFPLILTRTPADTLYVGWIGGSGPNPFNPDSASIYFDRAPGGGDLSKYRFKVNALSGFYNNTIIDKKDDLLGMSTRRRTTFRPADQGGNMGPGVYYCIVAAVKSSGDTLVSNEFQIMVDAPGAPKPIAPSGNNITNLTPTFSWERVANVPYYHIILSDEPLPVNLDDVNNPQIEGDLSIVWQAITPKTSITYGEPDPSGIITAPPPPLSPGKKYSWMVLSNFGNNIFFSSTKLSLPEPFFTFTVAGEPLNKPKNAEPANRAVLNSQDDAVIHFKWTNLDTNANTYLVNLFMEANPQDLLGIDAGEQANFKGSLLVWETTVSRGSSSQNDTLKVTVDAANTLTGGSYKWRVFAIDERGAGTSGDSSSFKYHVPSGTLTVRTREVVGSADGVNIEANVGVVELRSEVLSGPMEKPLAFYTSTDGYVFRDRPAGTYRITAVKDGYRTETRTVTINDGKNTDLTIYMERPKATIFGKVTDANDAPLNLANVSAVSEWGDSVSALTNGSGIFFLSCSDADWTVTVSMAGYRSSSPRKITLKDGQNFEISDIKLERNPIVFSGSIKNSSGVPIIGARVRIFREGNLIDELPSTPQSGDFSFSLAAGVYTVTAEKSGFATYSGEVSLSGNRIQNITLRAGAALINGAVVGRSWSNDLNRYVDAPIPSARVKFWEDDNNITVTDTVTVTSDAVFGNFSVGLEGGKQYRYTSSASGFTGDGVRSISAQSGQTQNITDTLHSLAMISGQVINEAGANIDGVDIVVFDLVNNRVAATGRSSNDGCFEVRNIYDGTFSINAAMAGFYLLDGSREFSVIGGKPQSASGTTDIFKPYVVKAGNTTIRWTVKDYKGTGYIKVASPFRATLAFGETLAEAGPGDYIIEAEAEDTTVLNLSYRKFTVVPGVTGVRDTFSLPLRYNGKDTLGVGDTLRVTVGNTDIDSARLFYRSEGSAHFNSVKGMGGAKSGSPFMFTFPENAMPRDGSNLYYYFNFYTKLNGGDIYGSQKQIYRSFVRSEPRRISRIEIIPGVTSGDTLILPSSYGAQFEFRAFYGSSFVPLSSKDMNELARSVRWTLGGSNSKDCKLEGSGLNVTVRTGSKVSADVVLTASLNLPSNSVFDVPNNLRSYSVPFKVSGSVLESMSILRTDPKSPDAINSTEEAMFRAFGIDKNGRIVTVSPEWSVVPRQAGVISSDGTFTPRANFVGSVSIFATAGSINAEFNPVSKENGVTRPGLAVSYMLRNRAAADTASNFKGLRIVFPAGSIDAGEVEHFEVSIPNMRNQVKKGGEEYRVADSVAFDIVPWGGNAKLNFAPDGNRGKITLILDIPSHLREEAKKNQNFYVAWWNVRKLKWQTTDEEGNEIISTIADDGSSVSAAVNHFSEYAVVMKPKGFTASLNISPNPFSPFIRPVKEYRRSDVPLGTCIKVGIAAPGQRVASMKIHIYNAVGHKVWAVEVLNPDVGEHEIWWDGRTTRREEMWDKGFNERNKRSAMARNGRYFVNVIVKNNDGEIKRVMKPVVLMK